MAATGYTGDGLRVREVGATQLADDVVCALLTRSVPGLLWSIVQAQHQTRKLEIEQHAEIGERSPEQLFDLAQPVAQRVGVQVETRRRHRHRLIGCPV